MDYNQAEIEFSRLKDRYIKSEIDARMFEELVNDLFVTDAAGYPWQMGVNTGSWYRFVGQHWVMDIPPVQNQPDLVGGFFYETPQSTSPLPGWGKRVAGFQRSAPEKLSHFPERMVSQKAGSTGRHISPHLVFRVTIILIMILVLILLKGR
jgi:hypothetical protein